MEAIGFEPASSRRGMLSGHVGCSSFLFSAHFLSSCCLLFLLLCPLSSLANDQGQFLLITDFHIDEKYDRQGDPAKMCHRTADNENETPKKQQQPELGPYGERTCDSSPNLVNFMLDEAKRHLPEPDFIIWTGDTPAHVNYTNSEFIETMRIATDLVKTRFPDVLVIPVLGNHDLSPSNNFPDDPKALSLYSAIFDDWKDWIGEEAKETFLKGGYYRFKSPKDGADYLVLNTNIYYTTNRAIDHFLNPNDPTGQFEFLKQQLDDIRRSGGHVHIIGHVSPGAYEWDTEGTVWNAQMPEKYNKRLVNLFIEYATSIRWLLFGHLHTDTFRIVKNSAGQPVQRIFLSPAITPMFQLNNPAFRIFEYNTTNADLIDIKTFYVDLDKLNEEGATKVHAELEYSMRDAYGLDSLDARAMNGLLERMGQDEELFHKYALHNKVMYTSPNVTNIDRFADRAIQLCVIGNLDLDRLEHCIAVSAAMSSMLASSMLLIFPVLFSLLFATSTIKF